MDPLHLAIDTSCSQPVVALLEGFECLQAWTGDPGPHHGELVLKGIDHCFERSKIEPEKLTFLSVGIGPGTFTGLRIGITTAKFLASAWKKQIVPVSSLYAQTQIVLSMQIVLSKQATLSNDDSKRTDDSARVWSLIDAHRNEVYASNYSIADIKGLQDKFSEREMAIALEDLAKEIQPSDLLVGDGAVNFQKYWPKDAKLLSTTSTPLTGKTIGRVAYQSFLDKRFQHVTAAEITAKYFRTEKY